MQTTSGNTQKGSHQLGVGAQTAVASECSATCTRWRLARWLAPTAAAANVGACNAGRPAQHMELSDRRSIEHRRVRHEEERGRY
eukprot:2210416-Pleurochrysis_carterae.AAC.2